MYLVRQKMDSLLLLTLASFAGKSILHSAQQSAFATPADTLYSTAFIPSVSGGVAQFYDTSSDVAFALSTGQNAGSTDLLFQLSAPQSASWGAVGVGGKMDGALMFIMYPSSEGDSAWKAPFGIAAPTDGL